MDDQPTPEQAERRFTELLEEAGLPRFTSSFHDPVLDELHLTWDHGLRVIIELTSEDSDPIDDWEPAASLDEEQEPIHVTVPGSADDPRSTTSIPGVVIHRAPPLHPDDLTTHKGIPVTSPSRTLIDLAEVMPADELRTAFARARDIGLSTRTRSAPPARVSSGARRSRCSTR